jgi:NAD(P)-dependent dehydrogenase (short-subunit alcohol dehydrogenase family)
MQNSQESVVITGSTRGIGRGMAGELLARGCRVVVSGRSPATVDRTVRSLEEAHGKGSVFGRACDVTDSRQIGELWRFARSRLGTVDIWINNAGVSQPWRRTWELDAAEVRKTVATNLLGTILGTRTALRGMIEQGAGKIFNLEGLGSDGRIIDRTSVYATTKRGIRYFTRAVAQEARNTPIVIGALSPGMVVTDLLQAPLETDRERFEEAKKVFNILADRVETVTPFLVEGILKASRSGTRIAWLTTSKVILRFLIAPFNRRDLFAGDRDATRGAEAHETREPSPP